MNDESPAEHYKIATDLAVAGQLAKAEIHLRAAIDAQPFRIGWKVALGRLLMRQKRLDEASELFSSLPMEACQPRWLAVMALCYWRVGKTFEAAIAMDRAMAQIENPPPGWRPFQNEISQAKKTGKSRVELSSKYYDLGYAESDGYRAPPEESSYLVSWQKIIKIIEESGSSSVMDIGCGPGQFAEFFVANLPECRYTGVDFSKVAIKAARVRCPAAAFIQMDLMKSDIPADHDAIICAEVLEHIEFDLDLISRLPSNKFFVGTVPNFDSFGHVRYFENEKEVRDRYRNSLSSVSVKRVPIKGNSHLFLIAGTTL